MVDPLVPIDLPPGLFRNGTRYQAKGRWYDGNLVRFITKTIQPVGGWRLMPGDDGDQLEALLGIPRGIIGWRGAAGDRFLGIGTTSNLYVLVGGVMHDITPAGFVPSTVDDSTPTTASGLYGAGPYGSGSYGSGSATSVIVEADNWQLDSFGDEMVGTTTSDRQLYVWDGDVSHLAAVPAGAPTEVSGVVVTPEGFLVALGYSNGVPNVRGLTWASQRTTDVWAPLITNSAGDFDLTTNGRILCGKRTRSETLIWTDTDAHQMVYIGGPLVYRFDQIGDKCGAISPRSPVVVDTMALWMGKKNFYLYDGFVKPIPCEVQDYVFGDFNDAQAIKVWGTSIAEFGEVWWFYPSADSTETNRYVCYNYRENHWSVGQLRRSAGCDAGALANPVMVSPTGIIFEHEVLTHRPGTESLAEAILQENGVGINTENGALLIEETDPFGSIDGDQLPYLESGPVEIGNGSQLMSLQKILPDENTLGDVQCTIYSALHPTDTETTHGPYTVANETDVRVNARQVRVRLEQAQDTSWRVGVIRFGGRPSSRR